MTTSNTVTKNDLAAILDDVLPIQGEDLTQAGVDSFVNGLNVNGSGFHSAKIGEVVCYAGTEAPYGWLKCDGSAVSRTTYSLLYSVIGTTYGSGDGSTTFNLPDLRDRFPVGAGSTYAVGSTGGEATVTLDISKIPSHDGHALGNNYISGVAAGETTYYLGANTVYGTDRPYIVRNGNELAMRSMSRGGGEAHNNMPPYMGMNYIIYAGGDLAPVSVTPTMTDWITEQGISGIWTYRKWASGISECWGRTAVVTPSSGVYSVDFPENLFVSISHMSVNPFYGYMTDANRDAQKYILTDGSNNSGAGLTKAIVYIRDYAGNVVNPNIAFDFNAHGRWK